MSIQSIVNRIARGGGNTRGRSRRSNRPRGEGAGLIDTVKRLFRKR